MFWSLQLQIPETLDEIPHVEHLLQQRCGFLGTNIDSLLGATLQQRGILSNSGVNVVSTIVGGIVAGAMWMALAYR